MVGGAHSLRPHQGRLWHTASSTYTPGEVLIFGGNSAQRFLSDSDTECHVNEVAVFRFSPIPLKRLCAEMISSSSALGKAGL